MFGPSETLGIQNKILSSCLSKLAGNLQCEEEPACTQCGGLEVL